MSEDGTGHLANSKALDSNRRALLGFRCLKSEYKYFSLYLKGSYCFEVQRGSFATLFASFEANSGLLCVTIPVALSTQLKHQLLR